MSPSPLPPDAGMGDGGRVDQTRTAALPDGQRPHQVRAALDIFLEVCDLPREERGPALDLACGEDALLRAAVTRMLAEDDPEGAPEADREGGFATGGGVRAVLDIAARRTPGRLERPPVLQGRYRIIRTIGEGGMGTVYEAEQVTPRRLVALKALRVGATDADDALRRFALEAEVLARLQHPGIAHIHEAGFGDEIGEGPAWIAMELVRGKPLVAAVLERGLDRRDRLRLFLQVCEAVSFAHRRGVIHRDLKPSNILLADPEPDATGNAALGRPKVLDFGVARVLGDAWDAATVLTSPGQLVGTLSYMSPEQVSGDPDAVDVRTDVYALGVIFYELLTGRRPYELKNKGLAEAITALREAEPPALSSLDPSLRGDLDAIGRTALAKEPRRRYQSVADLAADIERHLRGEPVSARADATLYVLWRQANRHRWPLALAIVVLAAIVAIAVRSTVEARRLTELAKRESEASARAQLARRELAIELDASQLEQARLLARSGSIASAEGVLGRRSGESAADGVDVPLLWAQREIAARHPRRIEWVAQDGDITALAFVPSMDLVVSASVDGCVTVSDLDGQFVADRLFDDGAQTIECDPIRDLLYVGGHNGTVACVTLPSLEPASSLAEDAVNIAPLRQRVRDIAVRGDLIALTAESGEVVVVDRATGERWSITQPRTAARIAFIDDDSVLFARADDFVFTHAFRTGQTRQIGRHFGGGISALAVHPDGTLGYTVGGERLVRIWNLETGIEADFIDAMNGTPREVAVDPRDDSILVSGWWTIDRWDRRTETRRRVGSHPEGNTQTLFVPERDLALNGHPGGVLRVWAIDDRAGGVAGPQLDGRTACEFSPDGRTLAVGDGFGQTLLLDAQTGAVRARPPQHTERAKEVGFSPDGRLFVSAADDGRLWLSDARNGSPIATFTGVDPTSSQSVVFSPDGRRLAVLCRDRSAKILDVPSLAVLVTLQLSTIHQAISVNWSPDGTRLVTSCRDRMIRVWSVDGTELAARSTDSATSWSAEYSPDGKMIAVGSWLRWVELRDPETLEVRAILQGAFGLITRVGWLPQEPGTNPLLYASSSDGAIRVWDTVSERLLFEFNPFPSSDMTDAALSRDGRYLAVTGAWGECIIWDLREWDRWSSRRLRTPTPAAAGRT